MSQLLGFDALKQLLGLSDQVIELFVGLNVELSEPFEERVEVVHGRVAEDAAVAGFVIGESFGEMGDQFAELGDECLFGKCHGFFESAGHALVFLLVQRGVELHQVVGRLDGREVPFNQEQTFKRGWIITCVIELTQALASGGLHGIEVEIEAAYQVIELLTMLLHVGVELSDLVASHETDAGIGER